MTEQLRTYSDDGSENGISPIETIQKENLLHKAVHVLIINPKGQIFVRERPLTKKVYPGMLTSSIGAHVTPDETPDTAAAVNLGKYLGLSLPLTKIGEIHIKDEFENEQVSVYVGHADEIPNLNEDQSGTGSRFMDIAEIQGLETARVTPHLREAVRLYQEIQVKHS